MSNCPTDAGLSYGRVRGGREHHVWVSAVTKGEQLEVAWHVGVGIPAGAHLRSDGS